MTSPMSRRQPAMSKMNLQSFLSDSRDSRSREYILTTRLVFDLTVAAAARGYNLLVYLPTVDSDGFDVILDDRDRLVPIQLKSIVEGGKASEWSVHRTLIRPKPEDADLYGFESSPNGVGRGGGVILTSVEAVGEAKVEVSYEYTDIDVLSAMWLGILPPRTAAQKKRLQRLRTELESDPKGSVKLPRSAFLTARSPEHLLAFSGLHSRVDRSWRLQLRALLALQHPRHEPPIAREPVPEATRSANIKRDLQEFSKPEDKRAV